MSLDSRIGSPAAIGERAIEPAISRAALGRSFRLMKPEPAEAAGHTCHFTFCADNLWPRPTSPLATRTSAVSILATGAGGSAAFGLERPASTAARPPAATATTRTAIRAAFIRFTLHLTRRPGRPSGGWISPANRQFMVNEVYPLATYFGGATGAAGLAWRREGGGGRSGSGLFSNLPRTLRAPSPRWGEGWGEGEHEFR